MTTQTPTRRIPTVVFTVAALLFALVIACVVSLAASSHPDGLEYVAESSGFLDSAQDSAVVGSPLADYTATFVGNPWLSVAIAGAVGCALTFGIAWLVSLVAKRRTSADTTRVD